VAITVGLGALLMLAAYSRQLTADVHATLSQQAQERVRLLDRGQEPGTVAPILQEESMVWIGRPDGTTVANDGPVVPLESPLEAEGFDAGGGIGGTGRLTLLVDERSTDDYDSPTGDDDHDGEDGEDGEHGDDGERERMDLLFASTASSDGSLVVVVGAEQERISAAVGSLSGLLAVGLPPLVLLAGGLTWLTTGWALRPVDRIRSRAEAISGTSLDDRVPVPDSGDEIQRLAVTVNEMLERIEAHDRSLRQFTADASHELKSPVANLRVLAETAHIDDPAWASLRARLTGEADRLQDLVGNLLFLAARDGGRPGGPPGPVALDELIFAEAEVVAATGRVTVDLSGVQPAEVVGVSGDLQRLVRNLVDNGARHARNRLALGTEVETDRSGRSVATLVVGDDGPGVAEQDRERIFERFGRLDEARARQDGGAGLGLAIVRGVATDHGATVTVTRSPLGGAEFRVRFPAMTGGASASG
jgi:signal transduction histidine kinase